MRPHPAWWLLAAALVASPPHGEALRLGLWAEAEGPNRTLDARPRLEAMLQAAEAMGIQDLFLQVYRRNRTWYASSVADDGPFRAALEKEGYDPLAYALATAHAKGLRVHAWMNLFNLARNAEAVVVKRLGRGAILTDSRGRSLLDYPNLQPGDGFSLDTPGYWLDPAHPGVQAYLLQVILELVDRYPTLDGLHFDYIRYPYALPMIPGSRHLSAGLDFGYGGETLRRFGAETGLDPRRVKEDAAVAEAWDHWRREQLTKFLRRLRTGVRKRNPRIVLSAALLSWVDRAYLIAFQDWRRWMEEGLLDVGIIMNYTRDGRLFGYLSRQAMAFRGRGKIYVGLGAYLFERPEVLLQQIEDAKRVEADGVVLFSYDNLLQRDGFFRAVRQAAP